jgi:hypothetical protein
LPGLTRQSIDLRKNFLAKKMDARVKPAHDELAKQLKLAPMGSSPRMTGNQLLKPVVQIAPLRDQSRDGRTLRVIRQK